MRADAPATPWRHAVTVADAQGGAIGYAQLLGCGLSPAAIGRRIRRGDLHPRHIGVYALGRPTLTRLGEAWAAHLAVGARGALALTSATALLGVSEWPDKPSVLVVGGPLRLDGVRVRRTRTFHPDELVETGGLRHTAWHRTVTDLAARSSVAELQSVLDRLERRRELDMVILDEAIRRARGRRGLRKLHRALVPFTSIPPAEYDSLLERFSAVVLHGAGLGDHEVQGRVTLGNGRTIHIDVLFRAARVAVEVDGRSSHDRSVQWGIDKERDRELQKLGFIVLRFTWQDVRDRPEMVVRDLRAVLSTRTAA